MNHFIVFLSFALCMTLAACGFSPVYGNGSVSGGPAVGGELAQIDIGNIRDREGQFLRNQLTDRFYKDGKATMPRYLLSIGTVNEGRVSLSVSKSADVTRAQMRMTTNMTLTDAQTNEILLRQPLTAITSYNILESQFTTRVTEQNARENALKELARQIELKLVLYFKNPVPYVPPEDGESDEEYNENRTLQ